MHRISLFIFALCLIAGDALGDQRENTAVQSARYTQMIESKLVEQGLQPADAKRLMSNMTEAHFTKEQIEEIEQQIRMANQEGIVLKSVTDKVVEGIAKRVDPDVIIQATNKVRERYEFSISAAQFFGQAKQSNLSGIIADCLASGLSRHDTEQIVAELQAKSSLMGKERLHDLAVETMTVSRDLVRQGVSSQTAAMIANRALQQGYDEVSMQKLRQTWNEQRAHRNLEQVAQRYGYAIEQGAKAHELNGSNVGGHGNLGSPQGVDQREGRGDQGTGNNGSDQGGPGAGGDTDGGNSGSGEGGGSSAGNGGSSSNTGSSAGKGGSEAAGSEAAGNSDSTGGGNGEGGHAGNAGSGGGGSGAENTGGSRN